jgi:hypothetical protein
MIVAEQTTIAFNTPIERHLSKQTAGNCYPYFVALASVLEDMKNHKN